MPYPPIEPKDEPALAELEAKASILFAQHRYAEALPAFDAAYNFMLQLQQEYGRRLHKGWPLHNRGISLLRLRLPDDAIVHFLLAYVEDALSVDPGNEDEADSTPAGRTLQELQAQASLIAAIKRICQLRKQRQEIPFEPNDVLAKAVAEEREVEAEKEPSPPPAVPRLSIDELERETRQRVFLGGAYGFGGPNLGDIRRYVEECGYVPIIAMEVATPERQEHDSSLRLLRLCGKAIFEVTATAGQLIELERCRDFFIEPLVVRNVVSGSKLEEQVSAMIRTMPGIGLKQYKDTNELRAIIREYLGCS